MVPRFLLITATALSCVAYCAAAFGCCVLSCLCHHSCPRSSEHCTAPVWACRHLAHGRTPVVTDEEEDESTEQGAWVARQGHAAQARAAQSSKSEQEVELQRVWGKPDYAPFPAAACCCCSCCATVGCGAARPGGGPIPAATLSATTCIRMHTEQSASEHGCCAPLQGAQGMPGRANKCMWWKGWRLAATHLPSNPALPSPAHSNLPWCTRR